MNQEELEETADLLEVTFGNEFTELEHHDQVRLIEDWIEVVKEYGERMTLSRYFYAIGRGNLYYYVKCLK